MIKYKCFAYNQSLSLTTAPQILRFEERLLHKFQMYAILTAEDKTQHGVYAVLLSCFEIGGISPMTTPLTIYGFGLCGNSANESIGKHRFRTKKHQKVNKSSQKTTPNRFGYWRPWVRVPPLRPFLAVLTAKRPQGSNTLRF